jgi:glucose-1-phosphate thymidylyltransferase
MDRKGIILAGGFGTRLYPITHIVSKQLLPVYDKPMIYYPLSTLMLAGIREILIITTPNDSAFFYKLLKDGSHLGINISYEIQKKPEGIAQAFHIGKEFINKSNVTLILGDNVFFGNNFSSLLKKNALQTKGASIFVTKVSEPNRFGVIEFDSHDRLLNIEEKPKSPKSKFVVTGLYFYDNSVIEKAKNIQPSHRGEFEITDLNKQFMNEGNLVLEKMTKDMKWLDTGTIESLHEAASYIRSFEKEKGLKIGCPEEIAWRMGFISDAQLFSLSENLLNSGYGEYLKTILDGDKRIFY